MAIATAKLVKGTENLTAALRALTQGMRQEVLLEGMRELCKPIEVAAKRFAKRSEDTGALRASITIKTVNYPKNGKAVGLIGPDRAVRRGKNKAGRLGQIFAGARRPSKYAHLVEYGHVAVAPKKGTSLKKKTASVATGGKAGGFVPAKPFIRPAVATTKAQQEQGFHRGLERGWNRIVKREVDSGRHVRS